MDAEKGGNKMCPIHYQRMKKNGTLQLTNPPPSDELKASIIDDYLSGESASQIGRCCGISGQKVCYWLIKWGISKRPHKFQLGHKLNTIKSRKTDGFGYILIYKPVHPNASRGFVREHRLVMEDVLGRLLTRDEVVHHINNDPSDNRPENLEVASQSTHARDHRIALGHLTNESGRYTVITLACQCCGKSYKRKIIKLCRPCRAPPISV
jgi:hypothetical protein